MPEATNTSTSRRSFLTGAATVTAAFGFNRIASAKADDSEAITQTAAFKIDTARADEALDALRTLVAAVEDKEPGVLAYVAHQNPESPEDIFFFEVYKDAEALKAHGTQPHLAALGAAFQSGLFKGPVNIVKLDRIGGYWR